NIHSSWNYITNAVGNFMHHMPMPLMMTGVATLAYTGYSFFVANKITGASNSPLEYDATIVGCNFRYKNVTFVSRNDNVELKGWLFFSNHQCNTNCIHNNEICNDNNNQHCNTNQNYNINNNQNCNTN